MPHNVYSDVALRAGIVLFGLTSWLTLFRIKAGALLALLCSLAIVPWLVRVGLRVWDASINSPQIVQFVHLGVSVLVFFSLVVSIRYVVSRGSWRSGTTAPGFVLKLILAAIPLTILITWFFVMGKV